MKLSLTTLTPSKQSADCLIVGVFENAQLTPAADELDKTSGGEITRMISQQDITGKIDQTLLLYSLPNVAARRILLVGCGKKQELNDTQFGRIVATAIYTLKNRGSKHIVNYLTELDIPNRNLHWKVRQALEVTLQAFYSFEQLKSNPNNVNRLETVDFFVPKSDELANAESALTEGAAICKGVEFVKDLANLPSNICTPTYIAQQAQELADSYKKLMKINILDRKDIEKLGMGSFLAVAKGSAEPLKFIVIEYHGASSDTQPVMLVGKGITFDTGGISLKPSPAMDEMKFDMCGAASVLGTIKAIAELGLAINVIGVIAATENMPGGAATKPGDIVKTLSGQTVEILNTDAEGRLILCDALTYCERYNPALVIDIATLTGAIVIALGGHASGLFTQDEALAHDIIKAANQSYDRVWQMPLWDDYQMGLDSNFADMANISNDRCAGSIMAACFLARFTKKFRWAHLDIAATAYRTGRDKGATGRPVPLLVQFLINYAKQHP